MAPERPLPGRCHFQLSGPGPLAAYAPAFVALSSERMYRLQIDCRSSIAAGRADSGGVRPPTGSSAAEEASAARGRQSRRLHSFPRPSCLSECLGDDRMAGIGRARRHFRTGAAGLEIGEFQGRGLCGTRSWFPILAAFYVVGARRRSADRSLNGHSIEIGLALGQGDLALACSQRLPRGCRHSMCRAMDQLLLVLGVQRGHRDLTSCAGPCPVLGAIPKGGLTSPIT